MNKKIILPRSIKIIYYQFNVEKEHIINYNVLFNFYDF
jgi:hypothetical protein